jgi:hypothetical protein
MEIIDYDNTIWEDMCSNVIYRLPEIAKDDPDIVNLLETIKKRKIPITHERKNSGIGRSTTFGIAYKKYQGHIYSYCANNKKYPELYDAILKVGRKVCPIPFYAIQVNHNYTAKPHIDKNNIGHSTILSIGDYDGGEFRVKDGKAVIEFDLCYKPIVVNAVKNMHWVNDIHRGDRYSFVFFTGKPIYNRKLNRLLKPSDVEELHKP